MSDSGHDLHSEFPGEESCLRRLKMESEAFRGLADRYHRIAKEIHRIETGIEAASDQRLEERKKERLAILDEVAGLIASTKAPA